MKALWGLPEKVIFCKKCVISNQRPGSVPEFKSKNSKNIETKRSTINFNDGICAAWIGTSFQASNRSPDPSGHAICMFGEAKPCSNQSSFVGYVLRLYRFFTMTALSRSCCSWSGRFLELAWTSWMFEELMSLGRDLMTRRTSSLSYPM